MLMGGFTCDQKAFVFCEQRELKQLILLMDNLFIKLFKVYYYMSLL